MRKFLVLITLPVLLETATAEAISANQRVRDHLRELQRRKALQKRKTLVPAWGWGRTPVKPKKPAAQMGFHNGCQQGLAKLESGQGGCVQRGSATPATKLRTVVRRPPVWRAKPRPVVRRVSRYVPKPPQRAKRVPARRR